MSILLLRQDKQDILDLLQRTLEKLCFTKLSRLEVERTIQHLAAMRLASEHMICSCTFSSTEEGKTILHIEYSFVAKEAKPDAPPPGAFRDT